MVINISDLKKKIIYRSNYRGTKEMDKLLGSFVNKYIDQLDNEELKLLCDFLDLEYDDLYKFIQNQKTTFEIEPNKITNLFKEYKYDKKKS